MNSSRSKPAPPLLTVAMPVYKGGRHEGRLLRRSLDSLLQQTFQDFKVLIVDNDSPDADDTAKIVSQYVKRDSRFLFRKNSANIGPYSNFAGLIMACDSEYYIDFHFDTYLAPTLFEECLKVLEADPEAVIAYSHCQFVDEVGNLLDLYKDTADFAHEDPGQRYLNVLSGMGWCTAYHGVWRHKATVRAQVETAAGRRNASMDNNFLALAALRGKLVQIPKPLFFRLKDDYQRKGETTETRFDRIYFAGGWYPRAFFLPFCAWIRDHCQDVLAADLPLDRKDELVHQTVSILLKRYKHMVDYELGRAVDLVLKGEFKKGLCGPDEAPPPKGQYKYLDFVYLSQLVMDLEYAAALRPDFPKLALARAVVRLELGQQPEALVALETAFRQNPADQEIQELRAKLQKIVEAAGPAALNP